MEVPKNASRVEVDRILSEEEARAITKEELEFADFAQAELTDSERERTSEWDLLTCVRGYQSFKPRDLETRKALANIWKWRGTVAYDTLLTGEDIVPPEVADTYHKLWPDQCFGVDKYGHVLMLMTLKDIDVEKISAIEEGMLVKLVAQKLTAFTEYRRRLSKKSDVQRYKYSICVDLDGAGVMGLVSGQKKAMLQKFFQIGGDFFPETIWKIYIINTPFVFRAAWGVAKAFVHPITQAKINVFPTTAKCIPQLEKDGWSADQLPELFKGTHKGMTLKDILDEVLTNKLGDDLEAKVNVSESS